MKSASKRTRVGSKATHFGFLCTAMAALLLLGSRNVRAGEEVEGAIQGMDKALNDYTARIFSKPDVDLFKAKTEILVPAREAMDQALRDELAASFKAYKVKVTDGSELLARPKADPNRPKRIRRQLAGGPSAGSGGINSVNGPQMAPKVSVPDSAPVRSGEAINGDQFPKFQNFPAKNGGAGLPANKVIQPGSN